MLSGFEEYLQRKTIQRTIIFLKKLCQETLKNVLWGGKDVTLIFWVNNKAIIKIIWLSYDVKDHTHLGGHLLCSTLFLIYLASFSNN